MNSSRSILTSGLSALILTSSVVVVFFSVESGIALALVALGVFCISRYKYPSVGFAGSISIVSGLIIFLYIYGTINRARPVFTVNPTLQVWLIILVGSVSLIIGLSAVGGSRASQPTLGKCDFTGSDLFFVAGFLALAVSVLNYLTGDIALLSEDINGTRFAGSGGLLGRLWPVILPVLQVNVIIAAVMLIERRRNLGWMALGISSIACLLLAGARSFTVIAFIAVGVIFIERRRPSVGAVLMSSVAGMVAFGLAGHARALASAGASDYANFMQRRGLDQWFGATDLSLQTGPRVLAVTIDRLNGELLGGQILFGDIANFVNPAVQRADRLVTSIVGRDPNFGGFPPTIFGGFFLDFGWLGLIVGGFLVGLALAVSRQIIYRHSNLSTFVWFAYLSSYVAVSFYSYVGLRPGWLAVLLLCCVVRLFQKEAHGSSSDRLKIPEVPGRRRASHERRY